MCVCMYYVCMYVHMSVCMNVCTYVCVYVCMYLLMYVCMDGCMCVCMCIYVCMYICMYMCMHVCIYIYNLLSACPITLAILHACRIHLQQVLFFLHEMLLFRMCGWLFILCMYVNIYESFHAGNVADICIKYE